jgi:hypothetical protein
MLALSLSLRCCWVQGGGFQNVEVGFEMLSLGLSAPIGWFWDVAAGWFRDVGTRFEMLGLTSRCWCWFQKVAVGFWDVCAEIKTSWLFSIPGSRHCGWLTLAIPWSMAVAKEKKVKCGRTPCKPPIESPPVWFCRRPLLLLSIWHLIIAEHALGAHIPLKRGGALDGSCAMRGSCCNGCA